MPAALWAWVVLFCAFERRGISKDAVRETPGFLLPCAEARLPACRQ